MKSSVASLVSFVIAFAGCAVAPVEDLGLGGASAIDLSTEDKVAALYATLDGLWVPEPTASTTSIGVCFKNLEPRWAAEVGWVRSAVESEWESAARVDFTGFGTCRGDEGIKVNIADVQPHTKGLGRSLGEMSLNFSFASWGTTCSAPKRRQGCIEAIAVHEFGHALGLAHEQNRPDVSCNDAPQGTNGVVFWAYDASSVMNYCNQFWNNNGKLSAGDRDGIARLYGRAGLNVKADKSYWLRWYNGTYANYNSNKSGSTTFGTLAWGSRVPIAFSIKNQRGGTSDLSYGQSVSISHNGLYLKASLPTRGAQVPFFELSKTAYYWRLVRPGNSASTSPVGVNAPFALKMPDRDLYLGRTQGRGGLNPGWELVGALSELTSWRAQGPR